MFDFLRNLTKSEEEKRQETLTAYLDNSLTPGERQAFEEQLRSDSALQASLEQQLLVKQQISQLPRMRAPRNFTLDPAAYGRPAPQPAIQLYPVLRAATALAAIMIIFLFLLDLFTTTGDGAERAAEPPIPFAIVSQEEALERPEDAGGTSQEVLPAAPAETFTEPAVEEESAEEAEEPAEAAVEEEMAEEAMEEAPAEQPAAGEEEAAPPAEPVVVAEGEAAEEPTSIQPTERSLTVTKESEPETTTEEGLATDQVLIPTTTLGFTPTITSDIETNVDLFSTAPAVPTTPVGLDQTAESQPIPPIQLLQIGLGILFLVLLAATLLVRRQL